MAIGTEILVACTPPTLTQQRLVCDRSDQTGSNITPRTQHPARQPSRVVVKAHQQKNPELLNIRAHIYLKRAPK
eukprot:5785398-Amphidinium_carterae.1